MWLLALKGPASQRRSTTYLAMHRVFGVEQARLGTRPSWAETMGPAGVLICTCYRINWEMLTASTVNIHDGRVFDMGSTSPEGIRALVKEATALESQQRAGVAPGVPALVGNLAIASVRSLMRSKDLTRTQRSTLGALVANGIWPCARLHQLGMCPSSLCQMWHGAGHPVSQGLGV